jgi:putative transposase
VEAKVVVEEWRSHYNDIRPHSSLEYKTPSEFKLALNNNLNLGLISLDNFGTKKPGMSLLF